MTRSAADFIEGMLVMIGFVLIVFGVNLVWDWHRHNEMERELQSWQAKGVIP
jgi:uncharacterized membrane protein